MLNNAKKLFYSIFNSKFCQRYSFKIIFIQIVAKTLAIQSLAHSKKYSFKIYKIIIEKQKKNLFWENFPKYGWVE